MTRLLNQICRQWKSCLALLLLLGLVACAPPPQEAGKRYFWPPGGSTPKIEYVNFYYSEDDIQRGVDNWLEDAVLGKLAPGLVFGRPTAITSDGKGRVFVIDQAVNRVLVWDFTKHELRALSYANGSNYQFRLAAGLEIDADGQIYVADSLAKEIHQFGPDEKFRRTIKAKELGRPTGLAFDAHRGGLYVVDTGNHQIHFFNLEGALVGSLGGRGVGEGEFNYPLDADVDKDGNLYVLDSMNARVQVFNPEGQFLRQFGERGTAQGSFQIPKSIAVGPSGQVYVTDSQAHKFVVFSTTGEFLSSVGGENHVQQGGGVSPGGLYLPEGIAVDSTDAIWVVDSMNRMFHQFQYLNAEYLKNHPILPGQAFFPLGFGSDANKQ